MGCVSPKAETSEEVVIWSPDLLDHRRGTRRAVTLALPGTVMAQVREIAPKQYSATIAKLIQAALDDPAIESLLPILPPDAEVSMKRSLTHQARVMLEPELISTIEQWVKLGYSWAYVTTVLVRRGLALRETRDAEPVVMAAEPEPEPDDPVVIPVDPEAQAEDEEIWGPVPTNCADCGVPMVGSVTVHLPGCIGPARAATMWKS